MASMFRGTTVALYAAGLNIVAAALPATGIKRSRTGVFSILRTVEGVVALHCQTISLSLLM